MSSYSCACRCVQIVLLVVLWLVAPSSAMRKKSVSRSLEVLIQRHGESMNNHNIRCLVPDTQLTELGVEQAQQAAKWVSTSVRPNISLSSVLIRAFQTAAITFKQKVYIADYLPETSFRLRPEGCREKPPGSRMDGSCPAVPEKQIDWIRNGRACADVPSGSGPATPDVEQYLDWSFLEGGRPKDGYLSTHKPDWHRFLVWLWGQGPIQQLVGQMMQGAPASISITAHKGTIANKIFENLPYTPKNTQIFKAMLPLKIEDGEAVGFMDQRPQDIECVYLCD